MRYTFDGTNGHQEVIDDATPEGRARLELLLKKGVPAGYTLAPVQVADEAQWTIVGFDAAMSGHYSTWRVAFDEKWRDLRFALPGLYTYPGAMEYFEQGWRNYYADRPAEPPLLRYMRDCYGVDAE